MADVSTVDNNQSVASQQSIVERLRRLLSQLDSRYSSVVQTFVTSQFENDPDLNREYSQSKINPRTNSIDFREVARKILESDERAELIQDTPDKTISKIAQGQARRATDSSRQNAFTETLNRINDLIEDMALEYGDQGELEAAPGKANFLSNYDRIRSARTTAYLQEIWIAFPQFLSLVEKMYDTFSNDMNHVIDANIEEIKKLDEGMATKLTEERKEEKKKSLRDDDRAAHSSLPPVARTQSSPSDKSSGEADSKGVAEQKIAAMKSLSKEKTAILQQVAYDLENKDKKFDYAGDNLDDLLIRLYGFSREELSHSREFGDNYTTLQSLFSERFGLKPTKGITPPRQADVRAAQDAIKIATMKNGRALTASQIEQVLYETNLPFFSDEFKESLQGMSAEMTYKNESSLGEARSVLIASSLPEEVKRALSDQKLTVADLSQVEEAVQRVLTQDGIQKPEELKAAIQKYLPPSQQNLTTAIERGLTRQITRTQTNVATSSSTLQGFGNLTALLDTEDLATENRQLLLQLDSAAFAVQVTTFASGSPANASQVIEHAIQAVARNNTTFKKSLENPAFKASVVEDLTSRVQLIKGKSLSLSGKLLGLNSYQQKSPRILFEEVFVIANNLGGSEAALATLLLTKPQLKELGEKMGSHLSPTANTLSRSSQPDDSKDLSAKPNNSYEKRFGSAASLLWVEAAQKGINIMSEDEFVLMVQGPGKTDKAAESYLRKLHAEVLRDIKTGGTYQQRKEIIIAAQQSQARLGEETNTNIENTPVAGSMFVTYSPGEDWSWSGDDEGEGVLGEIIYSAFGAEQGVEASDPGLTVDTSTPAKRLTNLRAFNKQRKQDQTVTKVASNAKWFANPLVTGGASVLGSAAIGFLTQGVAGGIGAGVTSLGGAIAGGFLIGGPIGAAIGGISAGIASLAWHPFGGGSLAQMTGQLVASPWADLGVNSFPTSNAAQTLGQLGQQGVSAAINAAPQTTMNAAASMNGVGGGIMNSATKLAGNVATNIPKALASFQVGGGALGTGAAVQLVGGPVIVITLSGYIIMSVITSAFITPGEIPCYDNVDVSVCKIASPSTANSVVDVVYQVTITAKDGADLTITGIEDVMSVQASSDATNVPQPPTSPGADTLTDTTGKKIMGLTIPAGTTISYSYTLPLIGKNEYFNTRIVNNLTVRYSGGSDNNVTAKAAVTFGVVNISACWPAPGRVTQGPWGSFDHDRLNEDAIDIGGNAGAPIYAPFDGKLTYKISPKDTSDPTGVKLTEYGNYAVLIANGYQYYFGHMISVPGNGVVTNVRKGDEIGNVGSTGYSTGPHLHYEIRPAGSNKNSVLNQFLPEPVDVNGTNHGSTVHTDSPLCGPN